MEAIDDLPLWKDKEANRVLEELCKAHQVPTEVLKELVAIERQHQHREVKRGIYEEFDGAFEKMD